MQVIENEGQADATFPNGLKLHLRPRDVDVLALYKVVSEFPNPEPPVVEVVRNGETIREVNTDSPSWHAALEAADKQRSLAVMEALATLTIDVVDLPSGKEPPESEGWAERLEALGYEIPANRLRRKTMWLIHYALGGTDVVEWIQLGNYLVAKSGISEEEVARLLGSFPGIAQGRAGRKAASAAPDANGARVPKTAPARRRP